MCPSALLFSSFSCLHLRGDAGHRLVTLQQDDYVRKVKRKVWVTSEKTGLTRHIRYYVWTQTDSMYNFCILPTTPASLVLEEKIPLSQQIHTAHVSLTLFVVGLCCHNLITLTIWDLLFLHLNLFKITVHALLTQVHNLKFLINRRSKIIQWTDDI